MDESSEPRRRLLAVARTLVDEGVLTPGEVKSLYFDGTVTVGDSEDRPELPGYLGRVLINPLREVVVLDLPGSPKGD